MRRAAAMASRWLSEPWLAPRPCSRQRIVVPFVVLGPLTPATRLPTVARLRRRAADLLRAGRGRPLRGRSARDLHSNADSSVEGDRMTVPIPRGLSFLKVALVVVAIVATACQQAATTSPTPGGSATPAASASAAAKRTITVIANWGGGERDAFQKVIDAFTAKTGIPVNYEQSRNLEALVRTRVAGGNPPDIAFEPRPGALAEFAKGGNLVPLDEPVGKEVLDPKAVDAALGKSFQNLGRVDGTLYGFLC